MPSDETDRPENPTAETETRLHQLSQRVTAMEERADNLEQIIKGLDLRSEALTPQNTGVLSLLIENDERTNRVIAAQQLDHDSIGLAIDAKDRADKQLAKAASTVIRQSKLLNIMLLTLVIVPFSLDFSFGYTKDAPTFEFRIKEVPTWIATAYAVGILVLVLDPSQFKMLASLIPSSGRSQSNSSDDGTNR